MWAEVVAADTELSRAQAVYAAAQVAVNRAGCALDRVLMTTAWRSLLPYIARNRDQQSPGLDVLATSFGWPALTDPPGTETRSDVFHFTTWWPLSYSPRDVRRRDALDWEAWAWMQLADGAYTTIDAMTIVFVQSWQPQYYSPASEEGRAIALAPVVIVTPERVEQHELLRLNRR